MRIKALSRTWSKLKLRLTSGRKKDSIKINDKNDILPIDVKTVLK